MHKFIDLLKRFRKDERGAFLAMFGILAVVLIATAGATVDFTSVQNARARAQAALDAAALALQPEIYSSAYANEAAMETAVKNLAKNLLINRLNDSKITIVGDLIADGNEANGTLNLRVTLQAPLYFVSLVGINTMNMTLTSQATKGSQDLEVSVALDVTGSMGNNGKIDALIDAANDMVDIIVLDTQTPTYTKMALVPWSAGVNVSSDIVAARGAATGGIPVTAAAWQSGTTDNIGAINRANPGRVTTLLPHGLANGDVVWLSGISNSSGSSGWTSLNNRKYTVTLDATLPLTRFTIGVSTQGSAGFSGSPSGGIVRKCLNADCEIEITTSVNHGFVDGDYLFFTGVNGMTQLNSSTTNINNEVPTYFTAQFLNATKFALNGTVGPTVNYSTYTSSGSAWCVKYGCQYLRFTPQTSGWGTPNPRLAEISANCVTERTTSPYQYTDDAPATAYVGKMYPPGSNVCPDEEVVPLTSNKTTLHNTINGLSDAGSTAGQIGTAWAWYMLSPNFASLWPTANQPAAYLTPNLIKVLVLMTDGSFNSVFCNGVISADSTSGSGSTDDHINCNATNGNPFDQTKDLCDEIKDDSTGIIVYTVGFDIANQSNEQDMLEYCASDPKADHYYLADNAAELSAAFTEIAQDISQLRLSE
jgi:Flp pilus assembly protein TadG